MSIDHGVSSLVFAFELDGKEKPEGLYLRNEALALLKCTRRNTLGTLPRGIMFTLLRGIWENYSQKPSVNILIVGLNNAGKTTLLEQIKVLLTGKSKSELPDTAPTIGLNVFKCEFDGIICQFWDLGGAREVQSLWARYYPDSHAVFFVVDSSDEARMLESKLAFECLLGDQSVDGVPVAILANKQDLSDADTTSLIKEVFNPLMPLLEARESKVFPVSAQKGSGIVEALEWLIRAVHNNLVHRPANFST